MATTSEVPAIRPFTVEIPEAEVEVLRERIMAGRRPGRDVLVDSNWLRARPSELPSRDRGERPRWARSGTP